MTVRRGFAKRATRCDPKVAVVRAEVAVEVKVDQDAAPVTPARRTAWVAQVVNVDLKAVNVANRVASEAAHKAGLQVAHKVAKDAIVPRAKR